MVRGSVFCRALRELPTQDEMRFRIRRVSNLKGAVICIAKHRFSSFHSKVLHMPVRCCSDSFAEESREVKWTSTHLLGEDAEIQAVRQARLNVFQYPHACGNPKYAPLPATGATRHLWTGQAEDALQSTAQQPELKSGLLSRLRAGCKSQDRDEPASRRPHHGNRHGAHGGDPV